MSLTNYKGIGSPENRTTVPLKRVLDESVTRARRDRFALQYAWPQPGEQLRPLDQAILNRLSQFLGEKQPEDDDNDDTDHPHPGGGGGGPRGPPGDDDQGDNQPPSTDTGAGPSTQPSGMEVDETEEDKDDIHSVASSVADSDAGDRPDQQKRRKTRDVVYHFKAKGVRKHVEKKFARKQLDVLKRIFRIISEQLEEGERNKRLSIYDSELVQWVTENQIIGLVQPTAKNR